MVLIVPRSSFLFQYLRITDTYSNRMNTPLYGKVHHIEHRQQVEQHIEIGERSDIEQQPVSFLSCDTLGTQLLVTGKQQIKTTGNGKHQFVFIFLLGTGDVTHTSALLYPGLQ